MTDVRSAERVWQTPPGIRLGPLSMVADGGARSVVVQMRHGRFHGFIVRRGDRLTGYVDRCPHMGLPLAQVLDDYLSDDRGLIRCSWHGALFAVEDGRCVGGPCGGHALTPWPVRVRDGDVLTGAAG